MIYDTCQIMREYEIQYPSDNIAHPWLGALNWAKEKQSKEPGCTRVHFHISNNRVPSPCFASDTIKGIKKTQMIALIDFPWSFAFTIRTQ